MYLTEQRYGYNKHLLNTSLLNIRVPRIRKIVLNSLIDLRKISITSQITKMG